MGDNFLGIDGVNADRCEIDERESVEIVDVADYALRVLFGLDFVRDMTNALLVYCVDTCGKRRKTTYKTIRMNCAKRNRHK